MFLCDSHHSLLTNHQPPQPGRIMGIFLRFHCSCGNDSMSHIVLTQPHNQAKSWEYFRDFIADVGMFLQVALHLHNHTTRQTCGNISAISLQPWECFCQLCCAYTTTQPGTVVGMFFHKSQYSVLLQHERTRTCHTK